MGGRWRGRAVVGAAGVGVFLVGMGFLPAASPPGMAYIPAGAFRMGSDRVDTGSGEAIRCASVKPCYLDEHPLHVVRLSAVYFDRYEVTNGQYHLFVMATASRPPAHWAEGPSGRVTYLEGEASLPITGVRWYEAARYCRWTGARLPTEAEWEQAAQGPDGLEFPWGNEFDRTRANTGEPVASGLMPVGSFELGQSPYGVYDMAGNVWEWVADWYQPYAGSTYRADTYGEKYKVLRGGSWGGLGHYHLPHFYRTAYRFYAAPEGAYPDVGFRCAKDVKSRFRTWWMAWRSHELS